MTAFTDRVWLRSHEEETGDIRVYRPKGRPLPPARGREGLAFHADGRFDYLSPGRGDRPTTEAGSWRADPADPAHLTAEVAGHPIEVTILSASDDELKLTWKS